MVTSVSRPRAPGVRSVSEDTELVSVREFERRMGDLVAVGARNGIDFDRSWTFRHRDDDVPDVMVEVTYLDESDVPGDAVDAADADDPHLDADADDPRNPDADADDPGDF